MSINRPSWYHSAVEVIDLINAELRQRLNSDAKPQGLWTLETGQLNLSKTGGGLRIIWSILGGDIERGWQTQGPDMPAPCRAIRNCRIRADICTNSPGTVGIAKEDQQQAEEILRAIILTWNNQRPADFDHDLQREIWAPYSGDPGQRMIVLQYEVIIQLLVLDDPYLFKTITKVDSTTVIGTPP